MLNATLSQLCIFTIMALCLPSYDDYCNLVVTDHECDSFANVEVLLGLNGQNGRVTDADGINYGTTDTEATATVVDPAGWNAAYGNGIVFNNSYTIPADNGNTELAHSIGSASDYAVMMSGIGTSYAFGKSNGRHNLSVVNGMNQEGQTRWLIQVICLEVHLAGPIPGNNVFTRAHCHNAGAFSSLTVDAAGNIENNMQGTYWVNDTMHVINVPPGAIVPSLILGTSRSFIVPPELLELSGNDLASRAEGFGGLNILWTGYATATIETYTSASLQPGGGGGGGVIVP